jgi:putative FmdB family regulatory protein
MPLYEYECFLCGHRFERIQRVSDETVPDCPECGGSVRRLLSAPALQFKGSGWYVTDYGKGTGGTAGEKPPEKKKEKEKETAATASEPKKTHKKDTPSSTSGSSESGDST